MTPGAILSAILSAAGFAAALVPDPRARAAISGAALALRDVPALVDELIEDGWDVEALEALRITLVRTLDQIPGVEAQHARRIAGGLVAVVDLVVTRASGAPSALRARARERAATLRSEARASLASGVAR